jgi:hypothetical protein
VEVADFYHYKEWENIICHGREKYILQNKWEEHIDLSISLSSLHWELLNLK